MSSNSVLDRIETNKLNVADILGNSDIDASQAAGSKRRKIKVPIDEGAELPEPSTEELPIGDPKSEVRIAEGPSKSKAAKGKKGASKSTKK